MKTRHFTKAVAPVGAALVALLLWASAAPAVPQWYDPVTQFGIKPHIPDFYQSQQAGNAADPNPLKPGYTNGNWWEKTGGWCGPTAFANCMYYWDHEGYGGLYPDGGANWLERMAYAIEDAAIEMKYNDVLANRDFNGGIDRYLVNHGHGPEKPLGENLVHARYRFSTTENKVQLETTPGTWVNTTYTSMFALYQDELLKCQDVLLTIISPTGGQHSITGSGVDCDDKKIIYADPATTKYGRAYTSTDPFPVGAAYYNTGVIGADGRTFTSDGDRSDWTIGWVHTVCPCIPEPISLLGVCMGSMALMGYLRRRRHPSA